MHLEKNIVQNSPAPIRKGGVWVNPEENTHLCLTILRSCLLDCLLACLPAPSCRELMMVHENEIDPSSLVWRGFFRFIKSRGLARGGRGCGGGEEEG